MALWQQLGVETIIRSILTQQVSNQHHFGRPFLTAYQIAIELSQQYPKEFAQLNMPVGGVGTNQHNSLAQYIAKELSTRIKSRAITDIEGGFLSNTCLEDITFNNKGNIIQSSLTGSGFPLSMFRLCEDTLEL